jgi:transposase
MEVSSHLQTERTKMKDCEKQMEILEAYELMGSTNGAANLLGISYHTVKRYVDQRNAGKPVTERKQQPKLTDEYVDKIVELVNRSSGHIRSDKVHEKIIAMGYLGSYRTTCYRVRQEKMKYRAGQQRVHRPWIPEPGMWLQYDFGDGPILFGKKTVLFVAWLGYSKYRVVFPLMDRQAPTVIASLDKVFRLLGGIPMYILTDNEKTATIKHIANLPVRNKTMVDVGRYYGAKFHTCVPFDPASKGGVERSVGLAKEDIVPKETNLLDEYNNFAEIEIACQKFMDKVNHEIHRTTGKIPADVLAEVELKTFHTIPEDPYTLALGEVRKVPSNTPMVTFEHCQYSVPYQLMNTAVWVRNNSDKSQVVITAETKQGIKEVARHPIGEQGVPRIIDEHFPNPPETPLNRTIKPRTKQEIEFCSIGEGAKLWLREATAQGVLAINSKMEKACEAALFFGKEAIDMALGTASVFNRFEYEDLISIAKNGSSEIELHQADESNSLAQGTGSWASVTGDIK